METSEFFFSFFLFFKVESKFQIILYSNHRLFQLISTI